MWPHLIIFAAMLVISFAMRPKPQSRPPAGLGDITAPTAEEGREIPVLFGTRDIEGPNVVWYGDFSSQKVKD